jgi:outer membrane protein assembly factor BamE
MSLLSRASAPFDVLSCPIGYDYQLALVRKHHTMRHLRFVIATAIGLSTAACSWDWLPFVYRQDIHQGNIISQEMVDQLRPGMTKRQVTYVMGAPLMIDPFHDERWDYVYSNQPGDEPRVQKNVTLIFSGDELAELQGDFRPGTLPSIEMKKDATINVPKIDRERTLWQMITDPFNSEAE